MTTQKMKLLVAACCCLAACQAGAADSGAAPDGSPLCEGYYNGEGPTAGTIVIDDRIFGTPQSGLIVRSGDRLSSLKALRSGQTIRYTCPSDPPAGSGSGSRTVREIWSGPR